jgi:hypothetical protein
LRFFDLVEDCFSSCISELSAGFDAWTTSELVVAIILDEKDQNSEKTIELKLLCPDDCN